jgi:hypothetical protein
MLLLLSSRDRVKMAEQHLLLWHSPLLLLWAWLLYLVTAALKEGGLARYRRIMIHKYALVT